MSADAWRVGSLDLAIVTETHRGTPCRPVAVLRGDEVTVLSSHDLRDLIAYATVAAERLEALEADWRRERRIEEQVAARVVVLRRRAEQGVR